MEKSAIQILLRSSLFSYAATAVFLLLLAFGMYRFQWGEKEITLGVRGIYILACFLAGLVAGKKAKRRRFLWGFCAGALYFLIFLFIWTSFLAPPLQSLCIASFLPLALEKSPGCA